MSRKRKSEVFSVRRLGLWSIPWLVVAGIALALVAAGNDRENPGLDKLPAFAAPPGPHIRVDISADKATHYQVLCDIRTYEAGPGQFANRYGVDTKGRFKGVITSPNAHCTVRLVAGPSVTVTLARIDFPPGQTATPKDTVTATITRSGEPGQVLLHLW